MIVQEHPLIMPDGSENEGLIRQYSDLNVMIENTQTGDRWEEAIDVYPCPWTYVETDEPIEPPEPEPEEDEATEEDYQAALNSLGVSTDEEE